MLDVAATVSAQLTPVHVVEINVTGAPSVINVDLSGLNAEGRKLVMEVHPLRLITLFDTGRDRRDSSLLLLVIAVRPEVGAGA